MLHGANLGRLCGAIGSRARSRRFVAVCIAVFVFVWLTSIAHLEFVRPHPASAESDSSPIPGVRLASGFLDHDTKLDTARVASQHNPRTLGLGLQLSGAKPISSETVELLVNAVKEEIARGPFKSDDFLGMRRRTALYRDVYDASALMSARLKPRGSDSNTDNVKTDREKNGTKGSVIDASVSDDKLFGQLDAALAQLEALTYPWLRSGGKYASVRALTNQHSGRGIVMTAGNWHFKHARHSITFIRQYLNSSIPIELFYAGDKDLDEDKRKELGAIPGVKIIDLAPLINLNGPEQINGWAIKPFSMLMSSFNEIIFVDADALFFQPPEVVFDSPGYIATGAVFFRDRTLFPGAESNPLKFFRNMVPNPSVYSQQQGRLIRKLSQHEGESGVIIWDKRRALHPLLLTCAMNTNPHRIHLYKAFHGDKESYWIAHEALNVPYWWVPGGGGTVGYPKPPPPTTTTTTAATATLTPAPAPDTKPVTSVCGGLYHADDFGRPLWFNGGILRNKYTSGGQISLTMTHWATDTTFRDIHWDWETETSPFCLAPPMPSTQVGKLSEIEQWLANGMVMLWDQLDRGGANAVFPVKS